MKRVISALLVAFVLCSMSVVIASAETTDSNKTFDVKKGDKVTYTMYLSDVPDPVAGTDASIYYNPEYLKLVECEAPKLSSFLYNNKPGGQITGEIIFNASDGVNGMNFKKKNVFITAQFEAVKSGKTSIEYIIRFLYDIYFDSKEGHDYIKVYVLTSDILINDKPVVENSTPVLSDDTNKGYGNFPNHEEGLGENNASAGLKNPTSKGVISKDKTETSERAESSVQSNADTNTNSSPNIGDNVNVNSNTSSNNNINSNSSDKKADSSSSVTSDVNSQQLTTNAKNAATIDQTKSDSNVPVSKIIIYVVIGAAIVAVIVVGVVLAMKNKKK